MKNYLLVIFFIFLFSSCSLPKIIIIDDKLTAEEHNNLGVIYLKQERFELAEQELKKAINISPNWDIPYFNLGNMYYVQKRFDKAERYYRLAIEKNPENADSLNNLAFMLYEQDRLDEALKLIEKAVSIRQKPEYLDTYERIKNRMLKKE